MTNTNFDPYDFSKKEIDGVPVYYKNLPWTPCINIRIVFNVGVFNDPVGKEGVSHFLEHMILTGCPSIPNKKANLEWSKENTLDSFGATTSHLNTWYTLKCLPEKYDTVLLGLKDMIFKSFLKTEDIEDERKVIIQEAWGRFLNEKHLKYIREFMNIAYQGNQLLRVQRALGWPETIEKLTPDDIRYWHKKNYGIGNFYIILTGAVDQSHIDRLTIFTKDLPKVDPSTYDFGIINKPTQNRVVKTAEEIGETKEQVEISLGRIIRKTSYQESEILSLLNRLTSDLLNEKLRTELSICYGVSSNISARRNFSGLSIEIKTEEKNVELVEKEFKNIFNGIIRGDYKERFEKIKKVYKEQLQSQEFISYRITEGVLDDITTYNGYITTETERFNFVEKVTHEDIMKYAKEFFDPEYIVTEIILPSKK